MSYVCLRVLRLLTPPVAARLRLIASVTREKRGVMHGLPTLNQDWEQDSVFVRQTRFVRQRPVSRASRRRRLGSPKASGVGAVPAPPSIHGAARRRRGCLRRSPARLCGGCPAPLLDARRASARCRRQRLTATMTTARSAKKRHSAPMPHTPFRVIGPRAAIVSGA